MLNRGHFVNFPVDESSRCLNGICMSTQNWNMPPSPSWWTHWVNVWASVITVLGGGILWVAPKDWGGVICAATLAIVTVIFMVQSIRERFNKRHRYSRILEHVHYVNHAIRDSVCEILLLKTKKSLSDIDFERLQKGTICTILNTLADAFSLVTGRRCSVCVKAILLANAPGDSVPMVRTFARDDISMKNGRADPDVKLKDIPVLENTAFESLWTNSSQRVFFCNDLPLLWREGGYKNTSFGHYKRPKIDQIFPWLTAFCRTRWELPYQSAIVVPIRYIFQDSIGNSQPQEGSEVDYYGFLCVDSKEKGAFCQEEAFMVMGAVADAIFMLVRICHKALDEITSPTSDFVK